MHVFVELEKLMQEFQELMKESMKEEIGLSDLADEFMGIEILFVGLEILILPTTVPFRSFSSITLELSVPILTPILTSLFRRGKRRSS